VAGAAGVDAGLFGADGCRGRGYPMVIEDKLVGRRSPFKTLAPLNQRLAEEVQRLEQEARSVPPGIERDRLIRRARQAETASHINAWLSSPGVQAPK
jgi:hypothetical protein